MTFLPIRSELGAAAETQRRSSPISFQRELFANCISEAKPLLERHWEELARNKDLFPLDPDYDRYLELEKAGAFFVYTARRDGKLVGYAAYLIHHNLHYRTMLFAESDLFWLAPEERKGVAGLKLLRFVENDLRENGVDVMHSTHKLEHGAAGKVLNFLGHTAIECGYAKLLRG